MPAQGRPSVPAPKGLDVQTLRNIAHVAKIPQAVLDEKDPCKRAERWEYLLPDVETRIRQTVLFVREFERVCRLVPSAIRLGERLYPPNLKSNPFLLEGAK